MVGSRAVINGSLSDYIYSLLGTGKDTSQKNTFLRQLALMVRQVTNFLALRLAVLQDTPDDFMAQLATQKATMTKVGNLESCYQLPVLLSN